MIEDNEKKSLKTIRKRGSTVTLYPPISYSLQADQKEAAQHKKASNHHANLKNGNVQFYIVTTWETPGNHWCWWPDTLIIARALAFLHSAAWKIDLFCSQTLCNGDILIKKFNNKNSPY